MEKILISKSMRFYNIKYITLSYHVVTTQELELNFKKRNNVISIFKFLLVLTPHSISRIRNILLGIWCIIYIEKSCCFLKF